MRYLAIRIKNIHETILKDIVGIQIRHKGKKKKSLWNSRETTQNIIRIVCAPGYSIYTMCVTPLVDVARNLCCTSFSNSCVSSSFHVADRETLLRVMLLTVIHFFVTCCRRWRPWDNYSCHVLDRDTLLRVMFPLLPTVRHFFVSYCRPWYTSSCHDADREKLFRVLLIYDKTRFRDLLSSFYRPVFLCPFN